MRTSVNPVILVVSGEEKWGAERIRQALSQNGFTTLACEVSDFKDALARHVPALVVANLSGNLETDQGVCQKLVINSPAPIMVIASSEDQEYTIALFADEMQVSNSPMGSPTEISPVLIPVSPKTWLDWALEHQAAKAVGRRSGVKRSKIVQPGQLSFWSNRKEE